MKNVKKINFQKNNNGFKSLWVFILSSNLWKNLIFIIILFIFLTDICLSTVTMISITGSPAEAE